MQVTSLFLLALVPFAVPAQDDTVRTDRVERLFERQCALCHGPTGRADGFASTYLFPPARDFGRARFRLATTTNGAPTDEDLVAVLRRGIPGSAMPSFGWLPEEDLVGLAEHVRGLAVDGWAAHLDDIGATESDLESRQLAEERMTPASRVALPEGFPTDAATLARGAELFSARCAACHGEDGEGRPELSRRDEDGTLNWARDFTSGILAGSIEPASLARRIRAGMHGSAMPAADLEDEQVGALVAHVRTLIPAGVQDHLVQERTTIVARRIEATAPFTADDPAWQGALWREVALAPLWWHDDAILHAYVAALHDGEDLALAVRWLDAAPDVPESKERPFTSPPYADAVAVQLTAEREPAFFGMTPGGKQANIWHWRALEAPAGESLDLFLDLVPHRFGDWLSAGGRRDLPLYRRVWERSKLEGETRGVVPAGARTLQEQVGLGAAPEATPEWKDGAWNVIFRRPLRPAPQEVELAPGTKLWANFAIWNGAVRDLRAQKSVTIWHALEIEE